MIVTAASAKIPLTLARTGHDVHGICLSYRSRNEGVFEDVEKNAQVTWNMLNIRRL